MRYKRDFDRRLRAAKPIKVGKLVSLETNDGTTTKESSSIMSLEFFE